MQTVAMRRPYLSSASSCLKKNGSTHHHGILLLRGDRQVTASSSSFGQATARASADSSSRLALRLGSARLYASEASSRTTSTSKLDQMVQSTKDSLEKRSAQQDRHTIDRQSDETSISGTDDAVAAQSSLSFGNDQSGNNVDPEQNRKKSGQDNAWANPLHISPANRKVSEGTVEVQDGGTRGNGVSGFSQEEEVTNKQGTYRSESKLKQTREAGFAKKAFAGSSKTVEDKKRPPIIPPGSR